MREERLAEEKVKKKVAAKKMGDVEARRRQEEEARKQKALQLVSCAGVLYCRKEGFGLGEWVW